MAPTTSTPPIAPIPVASRGVGVKGSAVIATKPANAPFKVIDKSALPNQSCAVINAATTPPAADALVLTKTIATALASPTSEILSSEPPLKPNQPNHKNKGTQSSQKAGYNQGLDKISPLCHITLTSP